MFERYTEKARRAIFFARYEASQNGSQHIESLHLLLGILRDNSYLFSKVGLRGNTLELAESCRRFLPASGKKISVSVDLPLSNECQEALTNALAEANQTGSEPITPMHLLLGLIKASSEVRGILNDHGVTAENLACVTAAPEENLGAAASGAAYGVITPVPGSAIIEFVCHGEQIGSTSLRFSNPVPRVGEQVVFQRENQPQTFNVLAVKYQFEGPPNSQSAAHAWLAKILIETERVDSPGTQPNRSTEP